MNTVEIFKCQSLLYCNNKLKNKEKKVIINNARIVRHLLQCNVLNVSPTRPEHF